METVINSIRENLINGNRNDAIKEISGLSKEQKKLALRHLYSNRSGDTMEGSIFRLILNLI